MAGAENAGKVDKGIFGGLAIRWVPSVARPILESGVNVTHGILYIISVAQSPSGIWESERISLQEGKVASRIVDVNIAIWFFVLVAGVAAYFQIKQSSERPARGKCRKRQHKERQ